jgi:hypothetical protein
MESKENKKKEKEEIKVSEENKKLPSLLKNERGNKIIGDNNQNEKKVKFINEEGKENIKENKISKENIFKNQEISKRHNSVFNPPTINFHKKFLFSDENIVELIDEKGNIKKEKIKNKEKENEEFKEKRKKRNSGEFVIAAEYFEKVKEESDSENSEETFNNTIKNQFANKLNKLDNASSRAPRKHKTVEYKQQFILNQ